MSRVLGEPKGKGASFSTRKLEVLKAAAKLFNERGFHSATMDDIAAALNVTKPALYYYAKSKDEILFEIGSIALSNATGVLDTLTTQENPPAESLEQFFIAWTESICQEFGRCLVLVKPELLEPDSRKISKSKRRKIHQQVISLIQAGINDGTIKQCHPELMSMALFDLFNGITYWYKPGGNMTPAEIAKEYWKNFGLGFLNNQTGS
jgi:AcrR family transcriptional regulator